jgi:C-terminal processing protease CtpA/Prc
VRTAVSLLAAATIAAQDPAVDALTLTPAQMTEDLRQLAVETAAKWAYAADRKQNGGLDLDAEADARIARLGDVKSDGGFVALVREFVAALRDGHAFVTWSGRERLPFRRWPITVQDVAEGLMVDTVLPTWTGQPAAFARGDVVLAVDGMPVADLVAAAMRRTNASTDAARRHGALASIVFHDQDPSEYRVRRLDGSEATVVAAAAAAIPEAAPRGLKPEARPLADGVVCIRIPTFAFADAKAWQEAEHAARASLLQQDVGAIRAAFAAATGCGALVLDLRGNGGGTDLLGMEVAACLLPADSVYYGLASAMLGWWSKPGFHRLRVQGTPPRFAGKLDVLIDEGCFSTTDNLCRCFDDLHPDVTFVGRPTGGGTGAPRACVTLRHSGAVVAFCTMRVFGPKGELIEGRGTKPDVAVPRTRADLLAARDADLEAALRLLR